MRVLLALASLLVFATSAAAECARVWWVTQGNTVEDHPFASYTAAQVCIRELDTKEQAARPDRTLLTTRSAATSLNITDRIKGSFSTTYQCLPDTVDPRGPKAKS
jgi:hypothetical protein